MQQKDLQSTGKNLSISTSNKDSFSQYEGDDQVVTSYELRDKLMGEKTTPHVNVKALIPGIDHACEGFQDGELIIISGVTKHGKTLLAQTFTMNFFKQKQYPGWFSYEVPARQFLDQFPILPLFYLPQKNQAADFNWFMERCLEAYFKYNTRIFFIDHLHYLIDMARVKNPSLDIGTIVRRVKRFAVDNDFVIFLLAHVSKTESDNVSYRDLRDSSFIAQEADTVIMVRRTPDDGQNTAKARVEFHRRTGVMEWVINLEKKHGLLVEVINE